MAKRSGLNFGTIFFLQLSLGAFFLALGIMGLTDYNKNISGFMRFLGRNDALKLTISIAELVMGGILLLGLFVTVPSAFARILSLAMFAVWGFYMVMTFIVNDPFQPSFIVWLYNLAWHSVILVSLWLVGSSYSA